MAITEAESPKMTTIVIDGKEIPLDLNSRLGKSLTRKVEEAEEEANAELVSEASKVFEAAVNGAFDSLSDELKLVLINKTYIARFNGERIIEKGMWNTNKMREIKRLRENTDS